MTAGIPQFGIDDASFQAAGGEPGIEQLVKAFYRHMDERAEASCIRRLYPQHLSDSHQRLAAFLSGWLGGPRRYAESYGSISIPGFHTRWTIGDSERDAWLACMALAIAEQPYSPAFASYLLMQLRVPAERIIQAQASCPTQLG